MSARLLAVAAIAAAAAMAFTTSADAEGSVHSGYFKTPSGSVYCDYHYGGQVAKYRYVRCGYASKLSPQEAKPKGGCPKGTDYVGNRMQVAATGRGETLPCAGDAGPFGNPGAAVAIPYGHTWHGGPFSCKSSQLGMTCTSTGGHGFRLTKSHWRVY